MKVVIDEKIPYLHEALTAMGMNVVALPGDVIKNNDLTDAGALFVRTRTVCDEALLYNTAVRFIGTATIGYDHIDVGYCRENDIVWTNAAGCNAGAVLQYVQSVIYSWSRDYGTPLKGLVLGVVGLGEIGGRVAAWAKNAGMKVLANDPPKADAGVCGLVSLQEIAEQCDIITFHPTLNIAGKYKSFHLGDEGFFASLQHCKLLVNASRGPVVDNVALLGAIKSGVVECAVVDVWEGEPRINLELLSKVYIATPHIAGYSLEGKINATSIVLAEFARYINYEGEMPKFSLQAPEQPYVEAVSEGEALLAIYEPLKDAAILKSFPGDFENLRNNYALRREPSAFKIDII